MPDDDRPQRLPEGRAWTDAEKRSVMERILAEWQRGDLRHLRLGQMLTAVAAVTPCRLFDVEDDALAEAVEAYAREGRWW
jgi:hypothetical protein